MRESRSKMRRERMKVIFEGNEGMIDVNTLITAMSHYNTIALAANQVYGKGESKLKVNVNSFERGSFVVDFSFGFVRDLFSAANVEYVAALVGIIGGIYKLSKYFKGKKVGRGEEGEAASVIGDVNVEIKQVTIAVYNVQQSRESIVKTFSAVQEDTAIDGLSIRDENNEELVRFDRSEFKELANCDVSDGTEQDERVVYDEDAQLSIISMSFEKGRKWSFFYKGRTISMNVKDDALMDAIDKGERFGKGDSIRARLRITQKYKPEYGTYVDSMYKIVGFYEHIAPPEQTCLPFEDEGR